MLIIMIKAEINEIIKKITEKINKPILVFGKDQ